MSTDPFASFKDRQREAWACFSPAALFTTPVAGHLVRFAGIKPGETVLDVGTGTGVVAITAARAGATVTGLDLTPALIEDAEENAGVAACTVRWDIGDAEALPYPDHSFEVVLSQFGHMFAPQPKRVVAEIARVLKPGGRVAFATWPPEHLAGRMFRFLGSHLPPPPEGVAPPPLWGSPQIIAERLEPSFQPPFFERGTMTIPALSLAHYRRTMEKTIGPFRVVLETFKDDPTKIAQIRRDFEALAAPYFRDNLIHQDYLLTAAKLA